MRLNSADVCCRVESFALDPNDPIKVATWVGKRVTDVSERQLNPAEQAA